VSDHVEGFYQEQILQPVTYMNQTIVKKRADERIRYYIPFTKEIVDKDIAKSDGSNKDTIQYVCKTTRGIHPCTYHEFVSKTWEELTDPKTLPYHTRSLFHLLNNPKKLSSDK